MTVSFGPDEQAAAERLIGLALAEDLGDAGDLTGKSLVAEESTGRVLLRNRQPGIVAGLPVVELLFRQLDPTVVVETMCADGDDRDSAGDLASLAGPVRSLLAGERTALNFLGHLSGIATLTGRFVAAVADRDAVILDTRKTLPGIRVLAKYAVRAGGGSNHRRALFDAVLIKDNHLAAAGGRSIAEAVGQSRNGVPAGVPIQVEVDTLDQLADALEGAPDAVLLDNMKPDQLAEAVAIRDAGAPGVLLEASGGITLETVAGIAATGIDRISIGALTHSAPCWDVGFDWDG